MLTSLVKVLLFVAIVGGLIYGVEYLIVNGYELRLAIANYEFTLGPLQAIVAGVVLLFVVWLVLRLIGLLIAVLKYLAGEETAIRRYFSRNRERRGYTALVDGFTALAAGDGQEAVTKAGKAERLLRRPDLTNLIRAQAAEMSGDTPMATKAYKEMLGSDATRFVGVRGLMKQKLTEGDTDTALKLAEKAFVLKPRNSDTSDTLLQLQAQKENWGGARKTLNAKRKYGNIPPELHKRRDAVLAVADSQKRIANGDLESARDEAIEANRLAPTLIPAAVAAARAYVALEKPKNAAKVLKTAWAKEPHPDLAAAFAEIAPNETAADRVTRFQKLIATAPGHPESRMLESELLIAAEDFPGARRAIGDLADTAPNARVMTLMAAIERGEGSDDSTVKAWLAKALSVSRGPQWICENCGQTHGDWVAICTSCGAFDTLSWKEAPEPEVLSGNSAAMLPLIVGALEKPSAAEDETTADVEVEADVIDVDASEAPDNLKAAG